MNRILFSIGPPEERSSLLSALLCAESACSLQMYFLIFIQVLLVLGVISVGTDLAPATFPPRSLNHWRSRSMLMLSSLNMRFHKRLTRLPQEKPPLIQFSAVPVLVHFLPYYKGIVGAHINDEETYKGQLCAGSCM